MEDKNKKEAAYNPDYFIDDLINLFSLFMEKTEAIKKIEFTIKQKSQIAGVMMGCANMFNKINNMLKEWGFLS